MNGVQMKYDMERAAEKVSIEFVIPEQDEIDEGGEPYFSVIVGDDVIPYCVDVVPVLGTAISNAESADIAAEWLEEFAARIRKSWATHNV